MALRRWVRPVCYCEIDTYAQGVLMSRMADGSLPSAPIWDDITTLKGKAIPERIDIITGGFPCQDISLAGRGAGVEGERSGLFFEIMRLVDELRPRFLFLENVPAITIRGGLRVTGEIASRGYDCRWCIVSAAEVGAWHKRDRWWLLAYDDSESKRAKKGVEQKRECISAQHRNICQQISKAGDVAHSQSTRTKKDNSWLRQGFGGVNRRERPDTNEREISDNQSQRVQGQRPDRKQEPQSHGREGLSMCEGEGSNWWATEPHVDRVVHGLPHRAYRIKGLGNSVVPQSCRKAFKILAGME